MSKVFTSWSGGKDCCLACHRAIASGLDVRYLANTITEDGKRSRSHGLLAEALQVQSQAIGIPLIQRPTTWDGYEDVFVDMLQELKQKGIDGGVFGDIDFNAHYEWVEKVCKKADLVPHRPLWGQNQDKIMRDFIDLGFESIVVAARADIFDEEILGRKIDLDFIKQLQEMSKTKNITPCGEAGEYHTFVIDGPLFHKRIEILETRKVLREKSWCLEVLDLRTR
ncbi:diphthine--ammonia ligase [Chloroflexota bacterium]